MKFINKILLRWRNYENSRVLRSIRTRSSSRTRTLLWNYLEDHKNCKNEVNCMNDSKDFQDVESVRSGNSHVTSQPMLFPKHFIPEGLLRPSFVSPRRKEGLPDIWDGQEDGVPKACPKQAAADSQGSRLACVLSLRLAGGTSRGGRMN